MSLATDQAAARALQLSINRQNLELPANGWPATFGTINGGTSGASLAAAVAQANAQGGGIIQLGKGTYNITSPLSLNANGTCIIGNGEGLTFVQLDDAGGLAGGDGITVNSVTDCYLQGFTVSSTAARTAGTGIKVVGANNITAQPAQPTNQATISVNMQDLFIGIQTVDGPANAGAWGTRINGAQIIRTSAGGVGVKLNSNHGGQSYIRDLKLYNGNTIIDANRALAGIQYSAGADLEIHNVNTIYFQHGLLINPATGNVANVCITSDCEWDNNSQESILITTALGGGITGFQMVGGWCNTINDGVHATISLVGGNSMKFHGIDSWDGFVGFLLGAANNVIINGCELSGNTQGVFMQAGASHIKILNNNVNPKDGNNPTNGINIQGGANYIVTGNDCLGCTTPYTNVPGVSATQIFTGNI